MFERAQPKCPGVVFNSVVCWRSLSGHCAECLSAVVLCPSGVCTLSGRAVCWPLLSINTGIERRQGSVSVASHPWTADNGPRSPGTRQRNQQPQERKACLNSGCPQQATNSLHRPCLQWLEARQLITCTVRHALHSLGSEAN